jgi:hypothetical protein
MEIVHIFCSLARHCDGVDGKIFIHSEEFFFLAAGDSQRATFPEFSIAENENFPRFLIVKCDVE